ncbi:MAG: alginate export family protein, partial [candidate division Zixibacteria bacterium]|nr:alginate export family protein [candidate division Zixibacteria bacterium]
GSGNWGNTARAFEGADLSWRIDATVARLFALQPLERTGGKSAEEYRIFGAGANFTKVGLELLGLYEDDSDPAYIEQDRLDRISLGVYFTRKFGRSDIVVNGAYQLGDMRWTASQAVAQDIAAYMWTAEYGLSFAASTKPRLAIGIDYTSGDTDTTSGNMSSYDNLFYTSHKSRGFMDYFTNSNVENFRGMIDLMARGKLEPAPGWTLLADIHRFATAVESDEALGWEIDLTAASTRVKGMKLDLGASVFLPSEAYARTIDPDPGFWMYTSVTVDF